MAQTQMVQILKFPQTVHKDRVKVDLDKPTIEKVIGNLKFRDAAIFPVCVIGPRRSGKSFLVNLLISRFTFDGQKGKSWLEDKRIVEGVEWSRGKEQVTRGMFVWPEPLMVKNAKGKDVAILLFDCQGLYEASDCAETIDVIMTLYSLELSSVYIFNCNEDINGKDLKHLKMCAEFAEDTGLTCKFKTLLMACRNWQADDDLGKREGYLEAKESEGKISTNEKKVKDSFANTVNFMLPYPGNYVAKLSVGDGTSPKKLAEKTDDFMVYVDKLAEFIAECANDEGHPVSYNDFVNDLKQLKKHSQNERNLEGFQSPAHVLEERVINTIKNELMEAFLSNLKSIDAKKFRKDEPERMMTAIECCRKETMKYLLQQKTERKTVLRRHDEREDLCEKTWQNVENEIQEHFDDLLDQKLQEFAIHHDIKNQSKWLTGIKVAGVAATATTAMFTVPIAVVVGAGSIAIHFLTARFIEKQIKEWRQAKFDKLKKEN